MNNKIKMSINLSRYLLRYASICLVSFFQYITIYGQSAVSQIPEFGLKISPGSQTPHSAVLVWGEGDPLPENLSYTVYKDGFPIDTTGKCFFQVTGLSPDKLYSLKVTLTQSSGEIVAQSDAVLVRTKSASDTVNVLDFGAIGDGKTWNTRQLQHAIDSCPHHGVVWIPKGIYLTGALVVKSYMTLHLDEGAVLQAVHDARAFPIVPGRFNGIEVKQYSSLINGGELHGRGIQEFSIRGKGVIDAEGHTLIQQEEDIPDNKQQAERGRIVSIYNGENIFFEGVSFLESPAWGVHFVYCHGITLHNIHVNTSYDPETGDPYIIHNGDGITLSSSKNAYIIGSSVVSQDDNISIKSGRNQDGWKVGRSTEHVRIYNCEFSTGFGVVLGSEISGNIRDVIVNNCSYVNTAQLIELKCRYYRGGTIENVKFKNLSLRDTMHVDMKWFRGGICIDEYYGIEFADQDYSKQYPVDIAMPTIRDAWFENISIYRTKGRGVYLCGRPERHIENIHFKNVMVDSPFPFEGRFVNNISLDNVHVSVPNGIEPYVWMHATGIVQQ